MTGVRFVACTFNVWADRRWPEREPALRAFLTLHEPDILCLQELRPETRAVIDHVLPGHGRVDDAFEGWIREGNVYWRQDIFDAVEHGAEDVGIMERLRRLFWVRLRFVAQPERTILVSTAHLTYSGNMLERIGGPSPRPAQAARIGAALSWTAVPGEPVLFMGDLNDLVYRLPGLKSVGLVDSFAALGRDAPATCPVPPTARGTQVALDWILHRGPIRPMTADAVTFYLGDLAPSDHRPVLTTYRLLDKTIT